MNYDLGDYAVMLADPVRGAAYLTAVRASVKPGHVVADIGSGPGVLGVYAALLGARRVFLIEPDDSVAVALALAGDNGVADRIEVMQSMSTQVQLPERADVIISDLRGVLPLFGTHIDAAVDMRARHLAPGGICIPHRDVLFTALVEDAAAYDAHVRTWDALPGEIAHASLDRLLANRWFRVHADGSTMLTDAEPWLTLDYDRPPARYEGLVSTRVTRAATAHAILCWFDTEMTPGIGFSNAPTAPRALYGQAMFPLATPLTVTEGDCVTIRLRAVPAGDEHHWTWDVRVERDGRVVGESRQSTLEGVPLSPSLLARRTDAFVPVRTREAEALQVMIDAADGTRSLRDIAARLHEKLPDQFPSVHQALRFVTQRASLWQ